MLISISLQRLRNVREALKANLDNAAQVEQEIGKLVRYVFQGQIHEVLSVKTIVETLVTSCLVVQNDLRNYLRLTANKIRSREAADKERNTLIQQTFEMMRKEKKEKEDTLSQVKQNLQTEKERTASLSKELTTLKEVFFATSTRDENRMQDWMLIKELNNKLDKENKKVSNLEDSLKLLKEEVLAKNETVSRLEELLRNERLEEQKKASALELQLEEEKKKCTKLERDLMRQQQGNCFLEEHIFESDKVADQHESSSHDEETTIEESIKVEVTEASRRECKIETR